MRNRFFIPLLLIGCMFAACTVDVPSGRPDAPVPIIFQAPAVGVATKTDSA